jgi:hypothetical protein
MRVRQQSSRLFPVNCMEFVTISSVQEQHGALIRRLNPVNRVELATISSSRRRGMDGGGWMAAQEQHGDLDERVVVTD